jgi:UDP-N-acetylmuramoyl-L-alanyl-D-glutamate--2,6-diaminopimelate ligase
LLFAEQAKASGARAVLFEPPAPETAPAPADAIPVPGLRARLGTIASRFHGAPSRGMTVIGVTGTNGKTSTVQLLAQALTRAGHVAGTIGTLGAGLHGRIAGGERTTPDVISVHGLIAAMRAEGATHLAMEVSSHALDQHRVDEVAFDVAVFTNLTRDHLDYHGDMDAYGAAKARLFAWPSLDAAAINRDDAFGRALLAQSRARRTFSYSAAGDAQADVRARDVATTSAGLSFVLEGPWGALPVASPLLGRFNVANLLAVATVLHALGWDGPRIAESLAALTPVTGRMNRLGGEAGLPLVVVDYAHTPDALEQTLASLRAHTPRRLVCVFGCGGDRDAGKRPQMGAIAERLADTIVITDDNPRSEDGDAIVAQVRAGLREPSRAIVERDRARAIARGIAMAEAGDTVLIAGKGHEAYQEVGARRLPFDDLDVARRALEAAA